jgi:hypothetical protein
VQGARCTRTPLTQQPIVHPQGLCHRRCASAPAAPRARLAPRQRLHARASTGARARRFAREPAGVAAQRGLHGFPVRPFQRAKASASAHSPQAPPEASRPSARPRSARAAPAGSPRALLGPSSPGVKGSHPAQRCPALLPHLAQASVWHV